LQPPLCSDAIFNLRRHKNQPVHCFCGVRSFVQFTTSSRGIGLSALLDFIIPVVKAGDQVGCPRKQSHLLDSSRYLQIDFAAIAMDCSLPPKR